MSSGVDKDRGGASAFPSGRVLASNTVWNLVGFASPMLIGLFAIPFLIDGFGKDRFGLLSIIWMGVGYFSLFDLGFGRAITKLVAEQLGKESSPNLNSAIWTALWMMCILGSIGALLVMTLTRALITNLLNVPVWLEAEGINSFRLLAACLPFIVVTSGLIGILEAHQRFPRIAVIRIPLGVITFLGPVLSLQFSTSLVWATVLLVAARLIAFAAYYFAAARVCVVLNTPMRPAWLHVGPLFKFGGWLTVSTIVGPIMLYSDRFLIGSLLTMTAVAYYTTPYEVLSRTQVFPQALFGVLFPAFAAGTSRPERLRELYDRANEVLLLTMAPLMALTFLFTPELLQLWLGTDFSSAASSAARWLALGWLHVMIARTNSTVLQATGRPDLLAKAHLLELVPFLFVLSWSVDKYGITGAGFAWCLRGVADAIFLAALVGLNAPVLRKRVLRSLWQLPLLWALFAGMHFIDGIALKLSLAVAITAASGWLLIKPVRLLLFARSPS